MPFAPLTEREQKLVSLFDEYREFFGFPDKESREQACKFEDLFSAAVCELVGHVMEPDQCMKPEHDFCEYCKAPRADCAPDSIREDFRLRIKTWPSLNR